MLAPKNYAKLEAHALQCLFASVATPKAPTVGEIETFIHKWVTFGFSTYQLQQCLDKCKFEGWVTVETKKHGKQMRRSYRITPSGALRLLDRYDVLHPHIKKGMEALVEKVVGGAHAALSQWFEQGA